MKTFPIMLDVRNRLAVVVGAGGVGMRKADSLLAAGAKVRIVSQKLSGQIPDAAEVITEAFRPEHIEGAMLVFACTDDEATNSAIAIAARDKGILVNSADQPAACDFFTPATVRQGDLVIAIGTGGAAPALAGKLKDTIATAIGPKMGEFAALIGEIRNQLKEKLPTTEARSLVLKKLCGDEGFQAFVAGGPEAVYNLVTKLTAEL
jgi:precorrin-2 dehydrogenase/sirohydrochlorin ferrochelatase